MGLKPCPNINLRWHSELLRWRWQVLALAASLWIMRSLHEARNPARSQNRKEQEILRNKLPACFVSDDESVWTLRCVVARAYSIRSDVTAAIVGRHEYIASGYSLRNSDTCKNAGVHGHRNSDARSGHRCE